MPSPSSLFQYDCLADRVRQHRQADTRPIVVVEGVGDEIVLSEVLANVQIFAAGGREPALLASQQLKAWNLKEWAVVVDNDFDLGGPRAQGLGHRFFPYLEADLEAMLIVLGALDVLLNHLGSQEKLKRLGGSATLRQTVCVNVQVVTALRQASAANRWGLDFEATDLASKIDRTTLEVRVEPYCRALLSKSDSDATMANLLTAAEKPPTGDHLFRGRDAVALAGVALRVLAGSLAHMPTKVDVLCSSLRNGAGLRLSSSQWLQDLQAVIAH